MRKTSTLGMMLLGVAGLMTATTAQARTEFTVTHTGQAPVNQCGTVENQVEGAARVLHLSPADQASLLEQVRAGGGESITHTSGTEYDYYTQCRNGRVVGVGGSSTVVVYRGASPLTAKRFVLPSGRWVDRIDSCGNYTTGGRPPVIVPPTNVTVTYTPPPVATETPPPVAMEPVFEEQEVEVVEKSKAEIEWEAIMGVWVGGSEQSNFRGAYAEATAYLPLGNGWKAGIGFYGMYGEGESTASAYSWNEHRYGPQFALRHDYMRCRERTYGELTQEECFPAGDGLKVRYLFDSVSGGNPDSGYAQTQTGHGVNIYLEHAERTSDNFMWGITGEAFLYGGGSINSTWSGDTPQNRSYYSVNAFGQWRLDDDWQVRAGLGLTHQAWDGTNYGILRAELRWRETVMCGPQYAIALNRPSSFNTLLGFCRVELGGTMRAWDQERRRRQVQLVQVGMRPVPVTDLMVERREPLTRAPTLDTITLELPTTVNPVAAPTPQLINLNNE